MGNPGYVQSDFSQWEVSGKFSDSAEGLSEKKTNFVHCLHLLLFSGGLTL